MKAFMACVLAMGVLRFLLSIAGIPDGTVKYFSMTAVIAVGALYFALATRSHRERLQAAFLLVVPYMIVEVGTLAYTWASGHQTIFHSTDYSLGFSIAAHTIGHFVGGLTWEPLFLFLLMEAIWGVATLGARLISKG